MVDLQFHCKRCSQGKKLKKARLSELPHDILFHILSYLTMKEAGRTSILSKGWRYLWSNIPTLNFYSPSLIYQIGVAQKLLEVETPKYIRWVDQVVGSYNRPTVDEFTVQCYLQANYVQNVDEWVIFAMERKVKRLQIYVLLLSGGHRSHCTFPSSFSDSLLNSLKLAGVNVTGEALEIFLVTCPVLESLCVENSDSLVDLRIGGQSLRLKYLIICYCNKIKKLEISAPELIDVTYHGPKIHVLPFKSNPKLTKICLGGNYAISLTNTFMEHSSYLYQLEALVLILQCIADRTMKSVKFPELKTLKELRVLISPQPYLDLQYMKPLIDACPSLYKFTLSLNNDTRVSERTLPAARTIIPHHHLKIVGLYGTAGVEFAICLLNCAVSLEKIIIDHHKLLQYRNPLGFASSEAKRNMAKQLGAYLKPGTDLLIF